MTQPSDAVGWQEPDLRPSRLASRTRLEQAARRRPEDQREAVLAEGTFAEDGTEGYHVAVFGLEHVDKRLYRVPACLVVEPEESDDADGGTALLDADDEEDDEDGSDLVPTPLGRLLSGSLSKIAGIVDFEPQNDTTVLIQIGWPVARWPDMHKRIMHAIADMLGVPTEIIEIHYFKHVSGKAGRILVQQVDDLDS